MQCPNCGYTQRTPGRFCARCGQPYPPPEAQPAPSTPSPLSPQSWSAPPSATPPHAPPPPYVPPPPPDWNPTPNPYAPPPYPPPYSAPTGYGYGYAGRSTNGLAVASLVLGLLGWLVCGVGSVVAIVLGVIARNQIRSSGGRETGDGMALAGIILGCIGVVLVVAYLVTAVATTSTP